MCTIFFAFKQHPDHPLIVAANRDEFYARATAPLQTWEDGTLGGRDKKFGGQWMACHHSGRFAALTNHRDPSRIIDDPISRGFLVNDFLTGTESPSDYIACIRPNRHRYEGFNLLLKDGDALLYYSNITDAPQALAPGYYGLSNALLDTPWPKVNAGKERFSHCIKANTDQQTLEQACLELLYNKQLAEDADLPSTGIAKDREKMLSACFITSPVYGTRASSFYCESRQHTYFFEQQFEAMGVAAKARSLTIDFK